MTDTVFVVGQKVIANHIDGYGNLLTKGKEYTVTKYQHGYNQESFTWPAYVSVIGDWGKEVKCHTYRFKAVD